MGGRDGTGNGCGLILVVYALSGEESSTTLRGLEDDGALLVASSLERCDNSGAGGDVDRGDGVLVLLCVLEQLENIVTGDDTGLAGENAETVSRGSDAILVAKTPGAMNETMLPVCNRDVLHRRWRSHAARGGIDSLLGTHCGCDCVFGT